MNILGPYCDSRALAIRLVAAVWGLAAFVLVPAYSGNLTSYLMSPDQTPIIRSIYDVPTIPRLKVAANRGLGAELAIVNVRLPGQDRLLAWIKWVSS